MYNLLFKILQLFDNKHIYERHVKAKIAEEYLKSYLNLKILEIDHSYTEKFNKLYNEMAIMSRELHFIKSVVNPDMDGL